MLLQVFRAMIGKLVFQDLLTKELLESIPALFTFIELAEGAVRFGVKDDVSEIGRSPLGDVGSSSDAFVLDVLHAECVLSFA